MSNIYKAKVRHIKNAFYRTELTLFSEVALFLFCVKMLSQNRQGGFDMSAPFGYQVYGLYVSQGNVEENTEQAQKLVRELASMGLRIEKFQSKSRETVYFRIYHPARALDYDEVQVVDDLYRLCGGGTLGCGFLSQVAPPDPKQWTAAEEKSEYSVVADADSVRSAIPDEPDKVPSQAELTAATLAAELNAQFAHTGERINQMQVDAMVRNIERVQRLTKSGKFRVLDVDTWDHEESIHDYATEEDALIAILLDRAMQTLALSGPETSESISRGRIYDAYRKLEGGIRDGEIVGKFVGNDLTLVPLLAKLTASYEARSSSISYLYDPEGNFIGEWAI